jgi:hypothetical protein
LVNPVSRWGYQHGAVVLRLASVHRGRKTPGIHQQVDPVALSELGQPLPKRLITIVFEVHRGFRPDDQVDASRFIG